MQYKLSLKIESFLIHQFPSNYYLHVTNNCGLISLGLRSYPSDDPNTKSYKISDLNNSYIDFCNFFDLDGVVDYRKDVL